MLPCAKTKKTCWWVRLILLCRDNIAWYLNLPLVLWWPILKSICPKLTSWCHNLHKKDCYYSYPGRCHNLLHSLSKPKLNWLFIIYCILFIVHCSLFIVHCVLFIVHCLSSIVYRPSFIVHRLLFIVHC